MYKTTESESRKLEIIIGHAAAAAAAQQQPPSQLYHQVEQETSFPNKIILRDRIIAETAETQEEEKINEERQNEEKRAQILAAKANTILALDAKWKRIERRCLGIFMLICLLICVFSVITIVYLGRGGRFNTDYHKYRDLPATTCLGGLNITDIWYSPPYPFNTTPTYTPAWATYQTYGYLVNGSLVPVLGQIPNKLERMGYIDIPCGYCDDRANWVCSRSSCSCECRYRLGDLQIAIGKLQSVSNFTCVIDNTNTIFSLIPSADKLNYMYRCQQVGIITLAVGASVVVLASVISYWKICVSAHGLGNN